jgi:hypothetical protein
MMKVQEWKKLDEPEIIPCEAMLKQFTDYYGNKSYQCKNRASYVLGETYLCKLHAKEEALNILIDSQNEPDLHTTEFINKQPTI